MIAYHAKIVAKGGTSTLDFFKEDDDAAIKHCMAITGAFVEIRTTVDDRLVAELKP